MLRLVYLVRTAPVRVDGYRVDEEVALAGASMEATDKCIVDTDLRASSTVDAQMRQPLRCGGLGFSLLD
jgi:hypothetical protein